MFQRAKSSQLEEVKKSLNKLETRNDNLKKMVRKLTKNKKNMTEKKYNNNNIVTKAKNETQMQSGFNFTFCNRPFYSCVLSYLAMNASEAGGDPVLIQTSLLFSCKCQVVSIRTT